MVASVTATGKRRKRSGGRRTKPADRRRRICR